MKGEMSKPRANLTDSKLSVRIGDRKFIKALKVPMRPPPSLTAIGFLMKQLRKQFRAKYPNIASPVDLHSAALVEWETMSDADKAPYAAMAEESFKLYSKRLKEYTETFMVCTDCLAAYWDKKSQHSTMKGEESKPRASRTDSKLSVRNGGGKAAKGPIRPSRPPFALGDMDFFISHVFGKQFREKYPNNTSLHDLHYAARAEWETMSVVDKAPYVAMAEESWKEYEMRRKEYKKRIAEYIEYICAAEDSDYENRQAAKNAEEEVRINLAGLMIRQ